MVPCVTGIEPTSADTSPPAPPARRSAVRLARFSAAVLAVGTALIIGLPAVTRWQASRERTLPAPAGPYTVGRTSFAWRDTSRLDPLAPDSTAKREMFAWAWYPADSAAGAVQAPYLPEAWLRQLRRGRSEQRLDRVRGHALEGAPVSNAEARFPVLIFAPGAGMQPTHYTALAEEVASHGYVVIAVTHPYSTPAVVFPDGRVLRREQSRVPFSFVAMVPVFGADLVSTLDHVVAEHARGDAFFARLDTARVGVFGHSFGGAAAAEACRRDRRLRAGMDLDGSVFGDAMTNGVPQPFLLMMAGVDWWDRIRGEEPRFYPDRDQGYLHERMLFDRSPTAYYVTVPGLSHMNFADQAFFFDAREGLMETVGMRIDGPRTHELASRYIRAFFGRYLRGVESPERELERAPYDWVRLESHVVRAAVPPRPTKTPF
jgi:dienelactone hydrolase